MRTITTLLTLLAFAPLSVSVNRKSAPPCGVQ
nr:MAG TPA: hypothetical protein [Caudoviricetes sp.]